MNWKTYICAFICAAYYLPTIQAQQPAQYSLFMLNPYNYNTAYAGLDGSVSATAVFRKQWVNLAASPLTYQANIHTPVPYLRSGFGLGLERDQLGAETNSQIRLAYNYMLSLSDKTTLSIGAGGRLSQKSFDGSLFRTPEGNYEGSTFNHNDGILIDARSQGMTVGVEAGLYLKGEKFQLGAAAINLNEPLVELVSAQILQVRYKRAYFLQGQYTWDLAAEWQLQPSILLKTDLIKIQPEASILARYKQQFLLGLGYRGYSDFTQDAFILSAGLQINKNIMLGYAYDISLNVLRNLNAGSHEVVLNYNLRKEMGKKIPQKIIYNPRFL